MVKENEVYKCNVCGNMVEVLFVGGGELVCCDQKMQALEEKTEDTGNEKHVPVVEKTDDGYIVKVGEVQHPMEENHYIMWIELIADGAVYRANLKPGIEPQALFNVTANEVTAREYCNVHGLWKSK